MSFVDGFRVWILDFWVVVLNQTGNFFRILAFFACLVSRVLGFLPAATKGFDRHRKECGCGKKLSRMKFQTAKP